MQLREVTMRRAEIAAPAVALKDAAKKMATLNVRLLPVCERGRVIGALSDHDITVRATARGRDPQKTKVAEVMTRDVITCFDDQDVAEAARVMAEKQLRRLIVVDRNHHFVGVVTLTDLVLQAIEEEAAARP
jgi:CBS domain-containing protein